ncbi:MAG: 3-hydroxyacyl-CoA dehydrogenase NAD-binding domain-containing protein [Bacteriovoracales bacterium]|nr:3-hydroxyacyl-CoA dehydrogenase NAD-binding domain-containing protein [Bacteriovoracales bacterium]
MGLDRCGVERIGVIGAGQMGGGIAQVAAQRGFRVFLFDTSPKALDLALARMTAQLERGVKKGKWDEIHAKETSERIVKACELEDLKDCDFVIEAAKEDVGVKCDLFHRLDALLPPKAILTSNTSSISITRIGAATKRASRVAGMHFMNPVPVMPLVEGIRGLETSGEVFSVVEELAKAMGKTFIEALDRPGFVVNRILMPMINEACFALQEGLASAEHIDRAMKGGCNLPMGPLELADFIGLDTCLAIMGVIFEGLGESKYRPCPLLKQYVTAGRLGRKVGRGIYRYDEDLKKMG